MNVTTPSNFRLDKIMRFYKKIFILIFISFMSLHSFADIVKSSDFLCEQISQNPSFKYEDHFSPAFIKKIKYDQLISILKSIYDDDGVCTKVTILNIISTSSKIILKTRTTDQKFIISIDENNLISGLQYFGRATPKIIINSLDDVKVTLGSLGEISSFLVKNLSTHSLILDFNSNRRLALGSEFKLYILNYLNQQVALKKVNWNDKLQIIENQKSLPSGILQDYPNGSELTIKQFAGLMISMSDNTATDHLINYLGRANIEKSMEGFNSFLLDNYPFLTTMDFFRLKTLSTSQLDEYLANDILNKRKFIDELRNNLSRDNLIEKLQNWSQPKDIQRVEWYASMSDICDLVENIKHHADKDQNIYEILSYNNPFVWLENDPYFEYVGYKGGSEPGVLTMTFLVKTKKQDWACVSMGINNQIESLDESKVVDIYQALLNYAGQRLN